MPELPEVETVARTLSPRIVGRSIVAVRVREHRLRVAVSAALPAALTGRRVLGVERRAKSLIVALERGRVWVIHLGMTGRFTLRAATEPARAHDHVIACLDDGSALVFNDVRRFGRMAVVDVARVADEVGHGIEPLGPAFTPEFLFRVSRRRRLAIKSLLMDQRCIAGLGNIYANEVLFHAGVRPGRGAGRLTRRECAAIVEATRRVLHEAIARGGSTISDFRDGFERFGTYQRLHAVYGRAGEACRRCGVPVRARVLVGRSTFYCSRCQR